MELESKIDRLLLEGGDADVELIDVVGCAQPGFFPGVLAKQLGELSFEALDVSGQSGGAVVGRGEVCLQ